MKQGKNVNKGKNAENPVKEKGEKKGQEESSDDMSDDSITASSSTTSKTEKKEKKKKTKKRKKKKSNNSRVFDSSQYIAEYGEVPKMSGKVEEAASK